MKGFDSRFKDCPDYIIGVTKEIWEDRNINALEHYYAPDIIVRSPASVVVGNQGVIAATMSTLHEFPDRQLLGEDVIWCGSAQQGFLSSHRLLSTATHSGTGKYGIASGASLQYRIIADCHVINNQINDEWLVRDQSAIVRQTGKTAADYARELIDLEGGPEHCVMPLTPANDIQGPYTGIGNNNEWGQRYADIHNRIMSADFPVINTSYDRAVHTEYPGGLSAYGREAVDTFWLGLRASFPSAIFSIDHQIGRDDPQMPPRVAANPPINHFPGCLSPYQSSFQKNLGKLSRQ